MKTLTKKQITFAHYVADGLTASEAYRRAYGGNPNFTTTKREAYEVRHNKAVSAYIETLRAEMADASRLTREDVLARLDGLIVDPDIAPTARIQAIKVRNEMTGDNAPVAVNLFGLSELLTLIRRSGR